MSKKVGIIVLAVALAVGGAFLYKNNNETNTLVDGGSIESTQGTSEMKKEVLACEGSIHKIEVNDTGVVISVGDTKVSVHASTNIFKGENLLEVSDLKDGQEVKVYSDGEKQDILNGLKVEIIE